VTVNRQPVLEGEHVELRPLQRADFSDLYSVASDPLIWEQHPSKDRTEEDVFGRWFDEALESGGALVVIDRHNRSIVGTSRFAHYNPTGREVEIGWTFLARSCWGGPYNGEVKRLMLDHAFRWVDVVVFRVHAENIRSQRAVEKLGAICSGREVDPFGRGENQVFRLAAPDRGSLDALTVRR
jgi:RimJ/RimL family protein N-acetyltransferase